jgi:hypothetical protein
MRFGEGCPAPDGRPGVLNEITIQPGVIWPGIP